MTTILTEESVRLRVMSRFISAGGVAVAGSGGRETRVISLGNFGNFLIRVYSLAVSKFRQRNHSSYEVFKY